VEGVKFCALSLEEGTLHGARQLEDAMLGGETATGMQRWDGDCAGGEWRAQGAVSGERMGASIFVWLGVISETCVWQRPGCVWVWESVFARHDWQIILRVWALKFRSFLDLLIPGKSEKGSRRPACDGKSSHHDSRLVLIPLVGRAMLICVCSYTAGDEDDAGAAGIS